MARKKTPSRAPAPAPRARRTSFKDIQIAYLANGVSAVEALLKDGKASKMAVRKALTALRESGANAAALDGFVAAHMPKGSRGRAAAVAGSERSYRAQQLAKGSAFLRLPLEALGVKKGGLVAVRFESDRVVVTRV